MYKIKAVPKHSRIEGEDFQKRIRTNSPSIWLTGENTLKKFPGLAALKYSIVVAMEFGMSLPHDFTSINEL